jgi:hypothetical protein
MDINIDAPQNVRSLEGHTALIQKYLLNFVDLQYEDLYSLHNNRVHLQENPASLHAHAWSDALRVKHKLAEIDPIWRTIHVRVQTTDFRGNDLYIQICLTFPDGAKADVAACIRNWIENTTKDSAVSLGEGDGDSPGGLSATLEGKTGEQDTAGDSDT